MDMPVPKALIVALACVVIGIFVWWAMWREDFDGMRSSYRYKRRLKTREAMSLEEFYREFYHESGLSKDVVERYLRFESECWGVALGTVRPDDNHFKVNGDLDPTEYIRDLEDEFGISIPVSDLETLSGSFDSLVRYIHSRLAMNAEKKDG